MASSHFESLKNRFDVVLMKLSEFYYPIYKHFRQIINKALKQTPTEYTSDFVEKLYRRLNMPTSQTEFVSTMKDRYKRAPFLFAKAIDIMNCILHFTDYKRGIEIGRTVEMPEFWDKLYLLLLRMIHEHPEIYLNPNRWDTNYSHRLDALFRIFIATESSVSEPPRNNVVSANPYTLENKHRNEDMHQYKVRHATRTEIPPTELTDISSMSISPPQLQRQQYYHQSPRKQIHQTPSSISRSRISQKASQIHNSHRASRAPIQVQIPSKIL